MIRAKSSFTGLEGEYESLFEFYSCEAHYKVSQMFEDRGDSSEPLFTDVNGEDFGPLKVMFAKSSKYHTLPAANCMIVSSFL